jgi:hypothetical protein
MEKQWIGCAAGNFRQGRPAGLKPEIIVRHRLEGTLRDAAARFSKVGAALNYQLITQWGNEVRSINLWLRPTPPITQAS